MRTSLVDRAVADLAAEVTKPGFCARCGHTPCMTVQYPDYPCEWYAEPMALDLWVNLAHARAARAALGDDWLDHPGLDELLAVLGRSLAGLSDV